MNRDWIERHEWSDDELKRMKSDDQLVAMEEWFRQNYEDPSYRTPYESAEGGFIWIWGGPFEAHDELQARFSHLVPIIVIQHLADKLNGECPEWGPSERASDYEDFYAEALSKASNFQQTFAGAILDLEKLLDAKIDGSVEACFCRQLFVGAITAMESYLSEAFIWHVLKREELMRLFIETTPEFAKEKIPMSEIFRAAADVEKRASRYLADVVWHNLSKVKAMYLDTLGIEFPDVGSLIKAVITRHDLVHRNGKTKGGDELLVTREHVRQLIRECETLVVVVEAAFRSPEFAHRGEQERPF